MYTCDRCGKGSLVGSNSAHKHGGAWAMRAPKSRKVWRPNLQRVRVVLNGKLGRYWLCTKCLKVVKKPYIKKTKPTITPESSRVTPQTPA